MRNDCTLLLSSYDNGEDLWEGFFKALSVQWPEIDMPIVLNTETKDYHYYGYDIVTYHPCANKNMAWSERLIYVLNRIETEFVLIFLEDFWLDAPVDVAFFNQTLNWMKENIDVANFSFYPCLPGTNITDDRFERFELRPQKCEYKLNCQVGLWRTKELIGFLRPHESPWELEIFGSERAARYTQKFYVLKPDAPLIFSYGDNLTGCIIHKGKWVQDAVLPLAQKYNLDIDYSKRGFEDFKEIQDRESKTLLNKIKDKDVIKKGVKFLFKKVYWNYRRWLSIR